MDDNTRIDLHPRDGLRGKASMRTFKPGVSIVARGQMLDRLHFLYDGTAEIVPLPGTGEPRRTIEADCHSNTYAAFGVMSYRTRRPVSAAVVAVTECEIATFDSPALANAIRQSDEFAKKLLYSLLVRSDASRPIMLQLCERLKVLDVWTGTGDAEKFYAERLRKLPGLDEAVQDVMTALLVGRSGAKRLRDPHASEASLVISPAERPVR